MNLKPDRRTTRTRRALQQALYQLIERKPYEKISSEEICQRARVARSTFYVHFRSKDDLKRSAFDSLRRVLRERREAIASSDVVGRALSFSLPVFEHAQAHAAHYRALSRGRGAQVALRTLKQLLLGEVREAVTATSDPRMSEYFAHYVVGSYLSLLTAWLERGARESAAAMDANFRSWMTHGLQSGSMATRMTFE